MSTPAGWYPDPGSSPGYAVRWWDGERWTEHVAPGPGLGGAAPSTTAPPPPMRVVIPGVPDPQADLDQERSNAAMVRTALLCGAAGYAAQFIGIALLYHWLFHDFFNQINQANNQGTTSTTPVAFHTGAGFTAGSGLLQLVSLGLLAVQILFLVWMYRAAVLARNLGLPARHSPGMAVGGFIIPIVNLWFPYQSVVDMFPPGHPDRGLVLRWWLLWLGLGVAGVAVAFGSLASLWVGLALALLGGGLAWLAAQAARRVVERVGVVHGELVAGLPGSRGLGA